MSRIIAKGLYSGIGCVVKVKLEDGSPVIEVNGEHDERIQEEFNELLKNAPAMGGTYYPQPNTLLAAYSVLESSFFDDPPSIETEGDIGTIPTYEGEDIVY